MQWRADKIHVEFLEVEGDIVIVRFVTPVGAVTVMGAVDIDGRTLVVAGAHIQGERGVRPNELGVANIRALARAMLREIDCDEAYVEGEIRTTGAHPGHRPRPIRFRRYPDPQTE